LGWAWLLALVPVVCAAENPSWRVEGGEVDVVVPVRPGGAFEARTSSLEGTLTLGATEPPSLAGELSTELTTITTGIALRDRHLTENYLEVSKGGGFDRAVLSEIVLADADGAAFLGRTAFTATLLLHGVTAQVAGEGEIRAAGPNLRIAATFPLSLVDFGIEPPQYMGVGVANKVLVRVVFTAKPARTAE
jgi:polyisoprenoid-binding protein YceI